MSDASGLNNPRATGTSATPLLRVLLAGQPIPGAMEATWNATSDFTPDTWTARFALDADTRYGKAWWDALDVPAELDLQVGQSVPGGGPAWFSLGIGQIDDVTFALEGGTVAVSGRSLAALLMEEKTAESYQNQTAGEIVRTVAARHGLAAVVMNTPGLQERLFASDFTRETAHAHSRSTNEWDLLVRLAQSDGCDLFVVGRALHYQPLPSLTDRPYVVLWDNATATAASPVSNGMELTLAHKLLLAKPVMVNVSSFHSRHGKAVKASASTTGARTGQNIGGVVATQRAKRPQVFEVVRPNLSQQQAQQLANSLLADITRHQRTVNWREPAGFPVLTPRDVVRLQGTGTGFDQVYYVHSVATSIGWAGYDMHVQAKNVSKTAAQVTGNA